MDESLNLKNLELQVQKSNRISSLWRKLCDCVFCEKLEISIQTLTNNFFFPIVCARRDDKTISFLEESLNQLNRRQERVISSYKKIYWWVTLFGFQIVNFLNYLSMVEK